MLQQNTLQFLQQLTTNNSKVWFDANRKTYENAKQDFQNLVEKLIAGIGTFDLPIADLEVKNCTFRINRDVRFSKNKNPYKTNFGAHFVKGGKKMMGAGYYLQVEPNNKSFLVGGVYMPEAADLAKIRQEIDYNFKAFAAIVSNKAFVKTFKQLSKDDGMVLSRPPKGYDVENEAIQYLKHKSFIASTPVTDEELTDKNFVKNTIAKCKLLQPLVQYLNQAIES